MHTPRHMLYSNAITVTLTHGRLAQVSEENIVIPVQVVIAIAICTQVLIRYSAGTVSITTLSRYKIYSHLCSLSAAVFYVRAMTCIANLVRGWRVGEAFRCGNTLTFRAR